MSIYTQPTPDPGIYIHAVTGHSPRQPATYFTDAQLDVEERAGFPQVFVWQEGEQWVIEVSMFSSNPDPSSEEIGILEGSLNEVAASGLL